MIQWLRQRLPRTIWAMEAAAAARPLVQRLGELEVQRLRRIGPAWAHTLTPLQDRQDRQLADGGTARLGRRELSQEDRKGEMTF